MSYLSECNNLTKEERGQRAKKHTADMALTYGEEIKACARNTEI